MGEPEKRTCLAPGCGKLGNIGRHKVVRGEILEYRWWCFDHESLADAADEHAAVVPASAPADLFSSVTKSR